MRYRTVFAAGLAVGYVLGTRAGRENYDRLVRLARRVADNPTAQRTAGAVSSQVTSVSKTIYTRVSDRMPVPAPRDFLTRPTDEELAAAAGEGSEPRRS